MADNQMAASQGHAVTFQQKFSGLPATLDGMITVGVVNGNIAYVSSSAVDDTSGSPGAAALSPIDAWVVAANDAGRTATAAGISNVLSKAGDWTRFAAAGFGFPQRARLVAFPEPGAGVHTAYEVLLLDPQAATPLAYKYFVDAQSGQVLYRQNAVSNLAQPTTFSGTYNPNACTTSDSAYNNGPFVVPAGQQSIDVAVTAVLPTNDIAINLIYSTTTEAAGSVVGSSDVATSPEAIHYAPNGGVPAGNYYVQTCQSPSPADASVAPYTYAGAFTTNDTASGSIPYPPKWAAFPAAPPLDYSSTDTRQLWCWESQITGIPVAGCQRALNNLAARGPWDYSFRTNEPTFTTIGNAAYTAEAWLSPLTPAEQIRPVSANRTYNFAWTNVWHTSNCNPSNLVPGVGNDIQASVANLFATHNRMHDWSYFLGFTENNFNLQDDNFGVNASGEHDPELGDVQAGAIGGAPPQDEETGRDNANQITLNDGVPGITNQYLFEPLPDAFYAPCVDGDFDFLVVGHEYTHAISHRMIGKSGGSISGTQGNSMGESWSDLDALEYAHEFNFIPQNGENDFAEGPYVTNNKSIGIRNYAINNSPLNYGNFGYDKTGPEVHADGEIWNAVNFDIRQALVNKYNATFPASNTTLQDQCAEGVPGSSPTAPLPPNQCPGNRRWIQIMYDAFLLENSGVSMLDARDAYLAADVMRFGGANQKEVWHAFARRGFGKLASTVDSNDTAPVPGFNSPLESSAVVTFKAIASDEASAPVTAKIYVGDYEARSRAIATTNSSSATANIVPDANYTYHFVAQAPGYGLFRFRAKFKAAGAQTITLKLPTNWASVTKGAVATGDGTNLNSLIDDTENTTWTQSGNPVAGSSVKVQFFGGAKTITQIQASALMQPGQSRFSGVRQFAVDACTATMVDPTCSLATSFTTVFTSPTDAFPSGIPRPLAPDLILRTFTIPTTTATHLRFRVLSNQCTGAPAYNGNQTTNDPVNPLVDCNQPGPLLALDQTGSNADITTVRASEFQAFAHAGAAAGSNVQASPILVSMSAPATAVPDTNLTHNINYTNPGPNSSQGAVVTDVLPWGLDFVSASGGGTYDAVTRTVTWSLGTVSSGTSGSLQLTTQVSLTSATLLSTLVNEAEYDDQNLTVIPTASASTFVSPIALP